MYIIFVLDKKSEVITLTEESWHMILIPNTSKFYCMACTCSYDLAYKRLHYFDEYHLKKLSECKVIEKYRHFCVRKVNVISLIYFCVWVLLEFTLSLNGVMKKLWGVSGKVCYEKDINIFLKIMVNALKE